MHTHKKDHNNYQHQTVTEIAVFGMNTFVERISVVLSN